MPTITQADLDAIMEYKQAMEELVAEQGRQIAVLQASVTEKTASELPQARVSAVVDRLVGCGLLDESDKSEAVRQFTAQPLLILDSLDKTAEEYATLSRSQAQPRGVSALGSAELQPAVEDTSRGAADRAWANKLAELAPYVRKTA
jgi:hypothetical protein